MAKSVVYAALEIGTHKVCVVVAEAYRDKGLKILGIGQASSRGVRKGEIVDFGIVQTCLNDALVRAEERSNVMIRSVVLGVAGGHIEAVDHVGSYELPEGQLEITEADVREAKESGRLVNLPNSNVVLHSVLRQYIVDGQAGVLQPIGREGRHLQAEYHIVHAIRSRIQNSIKCVREIPLEVEDLVFNPIAAAQVVLSRDAKREGVLMIDIGAGTSDFILYRDGMIAAVGSIPVAGEHISQDIASAFQISYQQAEKLKLEHGDCLFEGIDDEAAVKVEDNDGFVLGYAPQAMLNEVIYYRVREILELVKERCGERLMGVSRGVYLTGGTSLLRGISEVTQGIFGMKVNRVGENNQTGVLAASENPIYSVPLGLIRYAQILDQEKPQLSPLARLSRQVGKIMSTFR
jgi:cell division protein FtsA